MYQDTPNFTMYQNQFNNLNLSELLDSREQVGEPYRTFITDTYNIISNYFNDAAFRNTLTASRKNQIENYIANILPNLENLKMWQRDGATSISANLESIRASIEGLVDELDLRFTTPRNLYLLQNTGGVDAALQQIEAAKESAVESDEKIRRLVAETGEYIGVFTGHKLADYYQNLATGRSADDNDKFVQKQRKHISLKTPLIISAALFLFLLMASWSIHTGIQAKVLTMSHLYGTGIILGALILASTPLLFILGLKKVNDTFPGGYSRAAFFWMIGAILATIGTSIYASILVFQIGGRGTWESMIPSIISLLAPAYLIRFCAQNFKANRHLAIQNTHRATIARAVVPFSELIKHENKDFERDVLLSKIDIIKAATQVVFSQSETGYLTTKEGAGSGDNMLDSLSSANR